jgi:hypothetical protein
METESISEWANLEAIGIIDSYGCVHSKMIKTVDDWEKYTHDYFDFKSFDKWRWNEDRGVHVSLTSWGESVSEENHYKILNHLMRYSEIRKYIESSTSKEYEYFKSPNTTQPKPKTKLKPITVIKAFIKVIKPKKTITSETVHLKFKYHDGHTEIHADGCIGNDYTLCSQYSLAGEDWDDPTITEEKIDCADCISVIEYSKKIRKIEIGSLTT